MKTPFLGKVYLEIVKQLNLGVPNMKVLMAILLMLGITQAASAVTCTGVVTSISLQSNSSSRNNFGYSGNIGLRANIDINGNNRIFFLCGILGGADGYVFSGDLCDKVREILLISKFESQPVTLDFTYGSCDSPGPYLRSITLN